MLALVVLGCRVAAFATTRISNFPSFASSWRYRTCPLYSSKRPSRNEEYLYDDDDEDYYGQQYAGKSREETKLRNAEFDRVDDYIEERVEGHKRNNRSMEKYAYDDEDDEGESYEEEEEDYEEDDGEFDDDEQPLGNFWSNSKRGTDRPTASLSRQGRDSYRRDSRKDPYDERRRPRRR